MCYIATLHCNHLYFVYDIILLMLKLAKTMYSFKTTKQHSLFFDLLCTQMLVA